MTTLIRLAAVLGAFGWLSACVLDPADEPATGQASDGIGAPMMEREAIDLTMTEREVVALFRAYQKIGIDPCDPPPDPWHPFVVYGLCDCGAE